jgi:hypothetical protein
VLGGLGGGGDLAYVVLLDLVVDGVPAGECGGGGGIWFWPPPQQQQHQATLPDWAWRSTDLHLCQPRLAGITR